MNLAAQVTPEMLAATPRSTAASPPLTESIGAPAAGSGMTFKSFMHEYLHRNNDLWKPDQRRRRKDQCEIFLDLMGDAPIAKIDRAMMRRFADQIARIPDERHNVRRKHECPDASYRELIDLADRHDLPRLTVNAQQRLLDGLSEILTWAERETMIATNPAKGLGGELHKRSGKARVKPHEQREALSANDLERIFSATWCATGSGEKTAKGIFYSYRPHYYWLPLLAIFQGGRLNELSQLYLNDIKVTENGTAYLDFNLVGEGKMDVDDADAAPAGDKSLKTIASQRVVPIHQFVLDRGFLAYAQALRDAGHQRLFPELRFDKNKGYGKAAGSWFNERFLGNEFKIPRDGRKTFHSMRHNFATALGAAAIPTTIKSDLLGHARNLPLVEARYDKGGALNQLKKYIDAISYPLPTVATFNIEDGLQAIKDALQLKLSHARPASTAR